MLKSHIVKPLGYVHEVIVNSGEGRTIRRVILLNLLILLLLWPTQLKAAPTTAIQAENAVRGWLKVDIQPFGTALGQQISNVETFADANGQPAYYIVNLQPSGFVIVSADDMVEPIVGFVPAGTYDPSLDNPLGALVSRDMLNRIAAVRRNLRVTENGDLQKELSEQQADFQKVRVKAQNKWTRLENYVDAAEIKETSDLEATNEDTVVTMESMALSGLSDVRVYPLVQSKWDQGTVCGNYCYNYYTPNHYSSGCGPTAMAQLMRFHEYPTNGIGVHGFTIKVDGVPQTLYTRGGDGVGGPYSWSQMVFEPDCDTNETQRQAIGALCYDAGISAGVMYGTPSGVWMIGMTDALRTTLLYSNAIMGGDELNSNIGEGLIAMLNPNLDAAYPCFLGIYALGTGGHAIVCDGYGYDLSTLYHHLNMGWSGASNAWYNLPNIDSSPSFNTVDSCIYNIFTSGSGEIISGRVTYTSGIPLSDAIVTAQGNGGPYTTTTNDKGIYALAKVASGSVYTVNVTKTGYLFDEQITTTGTSVDYAFTSGNCWGIDFVGSGSVPPVTFVDVDAMGNNDGSSWSDAFTSLHQALNEVLIYTDEIRVAQGIYMPAEPSGNREATFQLINGVIIKGGYAGFGEPNPDIRNIVLYETVLSGDLNGNDGPNFTNNSENSYHVITASGTDSSVVFDGFTVTGGNANGSSPNNSGSGMYNDSGSPMLVNCTFSSNLANNHGRGGGMYNRNSSSPTITNCIFSGNVAQGGWAYGGGIYNAGSSPSLTSCVFSGNSAGREGGGMYNRNSSSPSVTNCTFYGNSAVVNGGGICNRDGDGSNPILTSSILWNNSDSGGTDESAQIYGSAPVINYSCIKGWTGILGGIDNIGDNPLFVNTANGDYHLLWDSACINIGDPALGFDPDKKDVDGEPRVMVGRVDMGADEVGEKQADFTRDGIINMKDIMIFVEAWLSTPADNNWYTLCDLYEDDQINFSDWAELANNWLWQASWYNP